MVGLLVACGAVIARQIVGDFEPGNSLSVTTVHVGNIVVGIIERADVKLDIVVFDEPSRRSHSCYN